jgi:hypothetical protein
MTSMRNWYKATIGSDSTRAAAIAAGIPVATLSRQAPDALTPESVVKLAHAYQVSAIDGLVAQGFLSERDVEMIAARGALGEFSDQQLAEEVLRRMKLGSESARIFDLPVHSVGGMDDDAQEEWELRQVADREQIGELGPDEDDGA